jgi:phosphoribosylamine-glycine ligase
MREFILERKGRWVLKQQGKLDEIKGLNFVSKMDNSEDLLDFLPILEKNWIEGLKKDFVLQEKIEGHEMAVGSFWNGKEFMKDSDGDELCEENWEHKSLFPGNLGESTGEQYTVQRMIKAKYSKLFKETLDKCREILKNTSFKGDFDANTIVNEQGAWFLEFTPRMGVPATSGMLEFHKSSWYDLLKAIADGRQDKNFKYDPRFCIVSWIYTKPFPFVNSHKMTEAFESSKAPVGMQEIAETMSFRMSNSEGIKLNFKKDFTIEDWKHIHPDGIRFKDDRLEVANADGYILTVSEQGDTVDEAGRKVDDLLKKIVVPKAFWRNDFDKTNYHKSKEDLEKWGYLLSSEQIKNIDEDETKAKKELKEQKRKKVRAKLKQLVYDKKE